MRVLFYTWILFVGFQNIWSQPLLVVVLMVKNEASVIEATLQPFVDGGVKDFLIFDTGSTDGTQQVVSSFFKRHNITDAYVVEQPFIDFATSRNCALDAVHFYFPQATFMLMPDAEWYMHNAQGLLQFCAAHQYDYHASYFVPIRSDALGFYTSRLIRCRQGIRFVGVVHETLNRLTYVMLPDDIYFEWRSSLNGNKKSSQRWLRDRDILLTSYAKNPSDSRTLFYLGQTYECLHDWENAYTYYKKRAEIKGWDEEDFMTQYRLGRVAQMITTPHRKFGVPLPIQHYLAAVALRPHRAEPVIQIAKYYADVGDIQLAFLYASRAVKIAYPTKDLLFVERDLYDFARYDLLGICAWYVGEYELGEWAVRKALEVKPHAEHLHYYLKLYADRKSG